MTAWVPAFGQGRQERNRQDACPLIRLLVATAMIVCAPLPSRAQFQNLLVPANVPWVDTGVWLNEGQTLTLHAGGEVEIGRGANHTEQRLRVGPEGTFFFEDHELHRPFPLPAGGAGPAPCYALIGKIGEDGPAFYVGSKMSLIVPRTGRLFLGVNDFHHADNAGHFMVAVEVNQPLRPVRMVQRVPAGAPGGRPLPGAKVVIFYVDGLRPDVVQEMSAMGHLPNLTQIFLEGGTQVEHSLTVFPSDTITANGSLWTGCFSDRHGIKAQIGFDRKTRKTENYLEAVGPVASGLLLEREGADFVLLGVAQAAVRATAGPQAAQQFRAVHTSDIPPLSRHLARNGKTYGAGVLPIMSDLSPKLWMRYLTDEAPYLGTQRADRFVDEANTVYAIEHLLQQQDDVMVVWLPETDTVSHHEFRGAFGMARRTMAEADRMIGEVVGHLRRQGRLDKTYLILVSDHGHHGGDYEHLDRYDLANEFFHRPREVTPDGRWVGGGLGMTVRQHRWINQTAGDEPEQFVFVEAVGDGVGRVFLPRGAYWSGDWTGPNSAATLLRYPVSPKLPPANMFQMLACVEAHDVRPEKRFPIDLVLAKLDDSSILIHHRERGWAVIDRMRDDRGCWRYRYRMVTDLKVAGTLRAPSAESRLSLRESSATFAERKATMGPHSASADGARSVAATISFREIPYPSTDPLFLSSVLPPEMWGHYFDEPTWLRLTLPTPYPDSVVAMTRHLLWDARLQPRELRCAPDLVVSAAPGWQFNTFNEPGTAHGHPFHPTMRNSFYVAGPGVRCGAVLSEPARAVDLVPTVLEMVGAHYDPRQLDGCPLWTLFEESRAESGEWRAEVGSGEQRAESREPEKQSVWPSTLDSPLSMLPEPRFWQEVDLQTWSALPYHPRIEYPHQPRSIDRPKRTFDVHNVVYNALSLTELSVNRVIDDAAMFLGSPQPPLRTLYRRTQETLEAPPVRHPIEGDSPWLAEATQSLHWNKIALSDYNLYSTANLIRFDAVLDWSQRRWDRLDAWVADRLHLPARAAPACNVAVDMLQYTVWETRRVGTRVGARLLNEIVLNGLEDGAAWLLNHNRHEPAEVIVPPPPPRLPPTLQRLPPAGAVRIPSPGE